MTARALLRLFCLMLAPLALSSCLYLPGKFDSTLEVRADRSFTFTYTGEIVGIDLDKAMASGLEDKGGADSLNDDADSNAQDVAAEDSDAKFREVAEALRREAGFQKVDYQGGGKFWVEYRLSGTLTHSFVFPFNSDSAMIFPFVAIELRGRDAVRVKAPGFAKQDNSEMSQLSGTKAPPVKMDGTFTLSTDAEIVSQNNEAGAQMVHGLKTIRWRATPLTKDAPMAVLKVKAI
jgi:hypothetical protein